MEERNIVYTGLTQAASDLDCRDGELCLSHNIISQDGSMRPIALPDISFNLKAGEELLYVHRGEGYKNYLIRSLVKHETTISVYVDGTVVCSNPVTSDFTLSATFAESGVKTVVTRAVKTGEYKFELWPKGTAKYTSIESIENITPDDLSTYVAVGIKENYDNTKGGWSSEPITGLQEKLYFFTDKDKVKRTFIKDMGVRRIKQVNSIGSSIIILLDEGIQYLRFVEGVYKYLGNKPPELMMSFGINAERCELRFGANCSSNQAVSTLGPTGRVNEYNFDDVGLSEASNAIMGKINDTFMNECTKKGFFVHPFFVCYSYKLLGRDYMVSQPVYMPFVEYSRYPYVECLKFNMPGNVIKNFDCRMNYVKARLSYFVEQQCIDALKEWSDVISSVDIFVTEQMPIYNQAGKGEGVNKVFHLGEPPLENLCYGTFSDGFPVNDNVLDGGYFKHSSYPFKKYENRIFKTPVVKYEDFENNLKNASRFYLYKSIRIEDLKTKAMITDVVEPLENIVLQPRLDTIEDYNSHDAISASKSYVYNGRLNLVGVRKKFFGFSPSSFAIRSNAYEIGKHYGVPPEQEAGVIYYTHSKKTYEYKMTFLIKEDEQIVKAESVTSKLYDLGSSIFYPNPWAFKVLVERTKDNGNKEYAEIPLTEHQSMHCAYNMGFTLKFQPTYNETEYKVGIEAYDYNKVYTSDVGSIFNFPLSGRNTIGTGDILNVASVSKALSPGQFGQFPLYVFSTEGIWAMEVNPNTGLFSSVHLVSRDVCVNADSVTQIDGAILFISEKGVMVLEGSETRVVSSEMDGMSFRISSVRSLADILRKEQMLDELNGMLGFKEFISQSKIAYDYPNSRLLFFRPDRNYAYVYSLKSRAWATMSAKFKHVVTDYPNVFIQTSSNMVLDLFEKIDFDVPQDTRIVMLTRPIKFGDEFYKTVNAVINRGSMYRNKRGLILFASNDGINYHPIGSVIGFRMSRRQGSPFRYFRIGIVGDMSIEESISLTSVYITPKWRNRPR